MTAGAGLSRRFLEAVLLLGLVCLGSACGCRASRRPAAPPVREGARETTPTIEVREVFWPNGKLRERREGYLTPDNRFVDHGRFTRWFDNGVKEYEATYVHGKLDGVERQWHRNGVLRCEQHFVAGLRHGPRIEWDPEGRKRKEEHYAHDRPHGTWTVWSADGQVKWQARFSDGQPLPSP